MDEKKEIQIKILKSKEDEKVSDEEFLSVLRLVSPGTNFRSALDGALKSGKGALVLIENENTNETIEGGFKVNCRFTPQRLIELAKMDGAITLSKDMKKILQANVLLVPNSKISSSETGTRHKAAERTAKQTKSLVIAISERRHEITLFYRNKRYILKSTEDILRKANENIQLLEKQRELFDVNSEKLNSSELRNYPSLKNALKVIQKGRLIEKISEELKKTTIELGNEGALIKTRLKEIASGVEKETSLVIKDYTKIDIKKTRTILGCLTYDELIDEENILKSLAYDGATVNNTIKGWRMLSKTSLLEQDIAEILKEKKSLGQAINSSVRDIAKLIGEEKAQLFKGEIEKIKLNVY